LPTVDPEVSKLKFEREVSRLAERSSDLHQRGIFVVGTPAFPLVELVFVPRHLLRVAVAVQQTTIVMAPGSFAMAEVPSLAARAFKARFDLTDYDRRAPSLEFRDPWTNDLLLYDTMFRALEYQKERKAHLVLLPDHPTTHKPFLCIRGIREYHEHPQHSGDQWFLYRNEMSLFSIIMSLWRTSIDLSRPMLVPQPTGIGVQWSAEEKI
jgi:hypothetical protein